MYGVDVLYCAIVQYKFFECSKLCYRLGRAGAVSQMDQSADWSCLGGSCMSLGCFIFGGWVVWWLWEPQSCTEPPTATYYSPQVGIISRPDPTTILAAQPVCWAWQTHYVRLVSHSDCPSHPDKNSLVSSHHPFAIDFFLPSPPLPYFIFFAVASRYNWTVCSLPRQFLASISPRPSYFRRRRRRQRRQQQQQTSFLNKRPSLG